MIRGEIRAIDDGTEPVELRTQRRYPLQLRLSGEVLGERRFHFGGTTINMSSEGILFAADTPVPADSRLQLNVEWPARSGTGERLELLVFATVVRVREDAVAARIGNHALRAVADAAPASPPVLVSGSDGGISR